MDSCLSSLYIYKFHNSKKKYQWDFYCNESNSYKVYLEEQYGRYFQAIGQKLRQKNTLKTYDSRDLEEKHRKAGRVEMYQKTPKYIIKLLQLNVYIIDQKLA